MTPVAPPFFHASTAKPSAIPTSIHRSTILDLTAAHPLPSAYGSPIPSSQQQHLPPISPSRRQFLLSCPPEFAIRVANIPHFHEAMAARTRTCRGNPKVGYTTPGEFYESQAKALLYMPGLRVDHPPCANSNRDFRGPLFSFPRFFQSLTSRVLAARLARASNSIAAFLVFGLVLTQVT